MWVYRKDEKMIGKDVVVEYDVGYYIPESGGSFHTVATFSSEKDAADRVHYLNGGNPLPKEPLHSGSLPADIQGIAKLVQCRVLLKQRKWYAHLKGVIMEPTKYTGLNTHQILPLHDTPTRTMEDNIARFYNELRKLGVDTSKFSTYIEDGWVESVLRDLQEASPVFRFRTYKTNPPETYMERRIIEVWEGLVA